MKVLWICNMPMPGACEAFHLRVGHGGGWLYAEAKMLVSRGIDLFCCFADRHCDTLQKAFDGELTHYRVPRRKMSLFAYDPSMDFYFDKIVQETQPDLVHIHGTENATALSLMMSHPELTYIVSIQGILTNIKQHECCGIPFWGKRSINPFALVQGKGAALLQFRHRKGSKNEIRILERADYILGRTMFDEFFSGHVNNTAKYVRAHEHLRDGFYINKWSLNTCRKHSILVCSTMPLKGLHFAIEALSLVAEKYPDVQLRIIGKTRKNRLNITGYDLYIDALIKKYNLDEHIVFLGSINENSVINEMKEAHVFALTSTIENSPNMLGEAMMIGTPCVATFVGGVPDMIDHLKDGILYQHDAPYMLAGWIERIFADSDLCVKLSEAARKKARQLYDQENIDEIIDVYNRAASGSL